MIEVLINPLSSPFLVKDFWNLTKDHINTNTP